MANYPAAEGFASQLPVCERVDGKLSITFKTTGRLELYGDRIYLIDDYSETRHSIENVAMERDAWNRDEGSGKFPRLWIRDTNGNITQEGDVLSISFINGDPNSPIIEGSLDMLVTRHKDALLRFDLVKGSDNKREAQVLDNENVRITYTNDGSGEIALNIEGKEKGTGNITLNLTGTGFNNGNLNIITNGKLVVNSDRFIVGNDKESLQAILDDLISAIKAIQVNVPSAPGVSTLPVINEASFIAITQRINKYMS